MLSTFFKSPENFGSKFYYKVVVEEVLYSVHYYKLRPHLGLNIFSLSHARDTENIHLSCLLEQRNFWLIKDWPLQAGVNL